LNCFNRGHTRSERLIRVYVASPALIRSENPFSLLAANATGGGANSRLGAFRGNQSLVKVTSSFLYPQIDLTESRWEAAENAQNSEVVKLVSKTDAKLLKS
jgi:hypothetical protein